MSAAVSAAPEIELNGRTLDEHEGVPEDTFARSGQDFSLPPADGGRQAWSFLIVCFIVEALVWGKMLALRTRMTLSLGVRTLGFYYVINILAELNSDAGFPFSFGVFEKYYSTLPAFSSSPSGIAAVGTTATGIMYFLSPPVLYFMNRYPWTVRPLCWAGLAVLIIGLVLASFATKTWQLIATQGVLYGLGGALHYFPAIIYLDEWFVTRKGLAYGIMWAGTGVSGVVLPIVMQTLLSNYGFRTTLRAWVVFSTLLSVPSILYLKGRLPVPRYSDARQHRQQDFTFISTSTFWFMLAGNIFQGFGYFVPSYYLPSFAHTIGLSNLTGTVGVSLLNAAAVAGAISIGALVDRIDAISAIMIASSGAAIAIFLVWGFALSTAPLYLFAIMYGLFAGGYSSTWSGCAKVLQERCAATSGRAASHDGTARRGKRTMQTPMVMAMFAAGKGIGAVASGPLSAKILQADDWYRGVGGAFGTQYGGLIIWSGAMALLGGISFLGKVSSLV